MEKEIQDEDERDRGGTKKEQTDTQTVRYRDGERERGKKPHQRRQEVKGRRNKDKKRME